MMSARGKRRLRGSGALEHVATPQGQAHDGSHLRGKGSNAVWFAMRPIADRTRGGPCLIETVPMRRDLVFSLVLLLQLCLLPVATSHRSAAVAFRVILTSSRVDLGWWLRTESRLYPTLTSLVPCFVLTQNSRRFPLAVSDGETKLFARAMI